MKLIEKRGPFTMKRQTKYYFLDLYCSRRYLVENENGNSGVIWYMCITLCWMILVWTASLNFSNSMSEQR